MVDALCLLVHHVRAGCSLAMVDVLFLITVGSWYV